MNAKIWSAAVLGALVAAGLAGSADAATKRMKNQQVRVTGYPAGQFYIAPGDSVASIRQAYGRSEPAKLPPAVQSARAHDAGIPELIARGPTCRGPGDIPPGPSRCPLRPTSAFP